MKRHWIWFQLPKACFFSPKRSRGRKKKKKNKISHKKCPIVKEYQMEFESLGKCYIKAVAMFHMFPLWILSQTLANIDLSTGYHELIISTNI